MKRFISLLGAFTLVAVAVVLTATAATRRSEAKKPIVIGAPLGLSGFMSFYDGPLLIGAEVAVADYNAKGGVLGRKLKIIVTDTKSDQVETPNATLRVIDRGAQFIIPSMDYNYGGPAARTANSKGLIAISTAGDPRFGLQGIGRLTFNTYSGGVTEGATAAEFAYRNLKWKRPYVLEDQQIDHTKTVCRSFRESWAKIAGTPLAGEDIFRNSDQSIATQISRLRQAGNVDGLVLCSFPPGGISALRQIRAAGIDLPIVTNASFDGSYWLSAAPNEHNMYIMSAGVVPPGVDPSKTRSAIFQKIQTRMGKPPTHSTSALTGYSVIQAYVTAIQRAKSTKTADVLKQLESFRNEPLAIGPTTWTSKCHNPRNRSIVVIKVDNGKNIYVASVRPKYLPAAPC